MIWPQSEPTWQPGVRPCRFRKGGSGRGEAPFVPIAKRMIKSCPFLVVPLLVAGCAAMLATAAAAASPGRRGQHGLRSRQAVGPRSCRRLQAAARQGEAVALRRRPLAEQAGPDQQGQGSGHRARDGHLHAGARARPLCGRGPSRFQRQWRARPAGWRRLFAQPEGQPAQSQAALRQGRLHGRQRPGPGRA